jgi:hypothetical protein
MDENFKNLLDNLTPILTLKKFIQENDIQNSEFGQDNRRLTCYSENGAETVFRVGRNYQSESREKLIEEGNLVMNGYNGENWIYLLDTENWKTI